MPAAPPLGIGTKTLLLFSALLPFFGFCELHCLLLVKRSRLRVIDEG